MCNLSHVTEVLHRIHISLSSSYRTLKRFIIAICTSLPRQLLRPKNAWYFYTDIVTHYFVTLFSNTQARQFFFTFKFLLKHRYLTAAKFKDLAKFVSFAEIFFYYSFQIHCSYLLSKILRVLVQAKRWVACRWLIKLRVHSLEYGGLSLSLEIWQRFYEKKTFQMNRFFNENLKQKISNT